MADRSAIEWTDATWNPMVGCSRVSEGCRNCYAERMTWRAANMGIRRYEGLTKRVGDDVRWTSTVRLVEEVLEVPLGWRRPRRIFVNSMSDMFHEAVPLADIVRVFDVMQRAPHHVFQILTKRAERLAALAPELPWPRNVWQGVSVESPAYTERIEHLARVPAAVRFLSVEPLLGPIPRLPLEGVRWVSVGGESGPRHHPVDPGWVREIRDQCVEAGVPFFFKQWGGLRPKSGGRVLDGRTWDEMPV